MPLRPRHQRDNRGADETADSAAAAFELLERKVGISLLALFGAFTALAWWLDWQEANTPTEAGMPSMSWPVAGLFCPMWATMAVAMMLPTVFPIVLVQRFVAETRGEGWLTTIALIAGYLSIWFVTSLIPLAGIAAIGADLGNAPTTIRTAATGSILLAAGLFQFTAWQARCLKACRHPVAFVTDHDAGNGVLAWFRVGGVHGLFCVGCCAALMLVLAILGLMNLIWMAVATVVFFAEKNWRYGVQLTFGTGIIMAAAGLLILIGILVPVRVPFL